MKTWVLSLDWEDALVKGMATHSSSHALRIPWTEEPDWLQSIGSQRVRHDWVTNTSLSSTSMQTCTLCCCSIIRMCPTVTPWTVTRQASLSITNSQSLLKLMSIKLVMPPNHLIFCCSLLLLPSIFPSIKVFSNESVLCIRWPKYWSISFSMSPSSEYSGLISFRIEWFDFLAVQGTHRNLLQHHSSEASVLYHSAFFMVQILHPYMTTGKTKALTRWISAF